MPKKKPSGCVFCSIARGEDQKTTLLYKEQDIIVFKDRKPAAPHHYLVCPVSHIKDAKTLTRRHLDMVQRMLEIGKQVLEEQGGNLSEARLGFHWPPFHLISHLHLHVISPTSEMGFISRSMFRPNSWWFVEVDWVLDRLKQMPDENADESRVVASTSSS